MEPLRGTYLHSIHHPQRGHRAQGARQRRGFTHVWPAANTTAYTLHCAWYPGENHTAKLPLLKGSAQGARQRWDSTRVWPRQMFRTYIYPPTDKAVATSGLYSGRCFEYIVKILPCCWSKTIHMYNLAVAKPRWGIRDNLEMNLGEVQYEDSL